MLLRLILCYTLGFCCLGCDITQNSETKQSQADIYTREASTQLGMLESPIGSNRGPQVDKYNLTCGKDYLGSPWCATFTRWCFYQVGVSNVPGAYSPDWYDKSKVIAPDDVRVGDQALIYFNTLHRYAHTIACIKEIRTRGSHPIEVVTIEGNSNPDGGREGYGVFSRIRSLTDITLVRYNSP